MAYEAAEMAQISAWLTANLSRQPRWRSSWCARLRKRGGEEPYALRRAFRLARHVQGIDEIGAAMARHANIQPFQ
jgi:hypothetical protein